MAIAVVMPRLGWTMETGSIVEWLKREGEMVKRGEILLTVQGDKAINEIEALETGLLHLPTDGPKPGQEVPIGTVLAYLLKEGETLSMAPSAAFAEPAVAEAAQPPGRMLVEVTGRGRGARQITISPRARRIAKELQVTWQSLVGSGSSGRIVERDVRAAAQSMPSDDLMRVNPAARRLADELGVDLIALARANPGKRVTIADVEAAAVPSSAAPVSGDSVSQAPADGDSLQALSPIRRIVASRLAANARTTAPVTLTTDADATELVRLRDQIKADTESTGRVPSFNDLLAKIVSVALAEHPAINASWTDAGIVRHATINIGFAVDIDDGLLVPVIRDARSRTVQSIADESARLIAAARSGEISTADMHGGTFTITNLGMFDIDSFTPIVNLPECAILGVGRIVARPVVIDEQTEKIAVRKMVALSLTFDHRVVDGAPAARFIQRIKHLVERPYLWVAR